MDTNEDITKRLADYLNNLSENPEHIFRYLSSFIQFDLNVPSDELSNLIIKDKLSLLEKFKSDKLIYDYNVDLCDYPDGNKNISIIIKPRRTVEMINLNFTIKGDKKSENS